MEALMTKSKMDWLSNKRKRMTSTEMKGLQRQTPMRSCTGCMGKMLSRGRLMYPYLESATIDVFNNLVAWSSKYAINLYALNTHCQSICFPSFSLSLESALHFFIEFFSLLISFAIFFFSAFWSNFFFLSFLLCYFRSAIFYLIDFAFCFLKIYFCFPTERAAAEDLEVSTIESWERSIWSSAPFLVFFWCFFLLCCFLEYCLILPILILI